MGYYTFFIVFTGYLPPRKTKHGQSKKVTYRCLAPILDKLSILFIGRLMHVTNVLKNGA